MVVRPYLAEMTRSELGAVMVAGFATIAGSVMAAYIGFGVDAGHLLSASVMSAPAAVVIAKLMFPETGTPETMAGAEIHVEEKAVNLIDAAATGAIQGLKIAATVGAMLIAFLSIIAMINYLLGFVSTSLGELFGFEERKRELAHRLGVDPYSSNPVLQKQLNHFAWVSYVGGFGAMLVPFAGEPRPAERQALPASARAQEILRDYAPEDLRRLNRIELAVMGIPEQTSRAFIALASRDGWHCGRSPE